MTPRMIMVSRALAFWVLALVCCSPAAGAWFHHRFYDFEPDLDIGFPAVRQEIRKIVSFWQRLGVSGFRVDAAKHLPVGDLSAMLGGVSGNPYVYSEVIEGGSGNVSTAGGVVTLDLGSIVSQITTQLGLPEVSLRLPGGAGFTAFGFSAGFSGFGAGFFAGTLATTFFVALLTAFALTVTTPIESVISGKRCTVSTRPASCPSSPTRPTPPRSPSPPRNGH